MTQAFDETGAVTPVTVIAAGPCSVTRSARPSATATRRCSSPSAVHGKALSKPELGHLAKASAPPLRHLAEFRDEGAGLGVGDTVDTSVFAARAGRQDLRNLEGQGLQGTIKRHRFIRGPVTRLRYAARRVRSARRRPIHASSRARGPGEMGNKRVTQRGLEVVDVRPDEICCSRGAVPGPRRGYVEVRSDG